MIFENKIIEYAGIGRGGFLIKNDGTVKNITVILNDGTNFKLDLTN